MNMLMCGMVVVLVMPVSIMVAVRVMIVAAGRMVVVIVAVGGMSQRGRSRLLDLYAARNIAKLGYTRLDLGGFGLCLVEDQRQRRIRYGQGNPGDTR